MNGLLDFFKQGYQNSGLQELGNSIANQPKMYDPHANAQALMGGTPMNQQGLLNNVYGQGTDTFKNETGIVDPSQTYAQPEQIEQMNPGVMTPAYQQPVGPNYGGNLLNGSAPQQGITNPGGTGVNLGQTSQTWGSGYDGTPTEGYTPIDTTGSPDYGVNSITPKYKTETDETDYSAQTTPFLDKFAWSENSNGAHLTGELKEWAAQDGNKFDPSMTEEERLLREQAKARLPWYLGGTGGK